MHAFDAEICAATTGHESSGRAHTQIVSAAAILCLTTLPSHRGLFFLFVFSFRVKRLLDICHFYNLCAESSLITLNVKRWWIKTEPVNVVFSTKRLASHWNVGWLSWLYYPRRVWSWLAEDISSSTFLLRWRCDNKSIRLGQDESWSSLLARNKIIHWFVPCRGAVLLYRDSAN